MSNLPSKRSKPEWAAYEDQTFELFKEHFPAAIVERNISLVGRYSKRKRQVDILITETTPAGLVKTVVDTKFFKRKVDVKAVDELAGFVEDIGGQKGMLITNAGYTPAALRRAYYSPRDLELDILNFSALQRFQGLSAIPYKGHKAFLVGAPFGWVIDATKERGWLAAMYQRGLTFSEAFAKKEFLYIKFWDRRADPLDAAELDRQQVHAMRFRLGSVRVSHRVTVQRSDALTRLRIASVKNYGCLEVTGFLEFTNVIFFAVLLTPTESQRPNIRRLESVLKQAIPIQFERDNTALIRAIEVRLKEDLSVTERASLLCEAGHWYRDMDQLQHARNKLEESLSLEPKSYRTIKELLPVLVGLRERGRVKEVMQHLLRLDPRNPTVFNDCFEYGAGWLSPSEMLNLIDTLKAEKHDDPLVQANCDIYAGNLLSQPELARQRYLAAQRIFRGIFPPTHYVFRRLRDALRQDRIPGKKSRRGSLS